MKILQHNRDKPNSVVCNRADRSIKTEREFTMKKAMLITCTAMTALFISLTTGSTAHAFTTRIISKGLAPGICEIWLWTGVWPLSGTTVAYHSEIKSNSTTDFELGAGCQCRVICNDYGLDSGNLGPQCWSRNIYLNWDKTAKKATWEWTPFH